ncbi:hypothetical protein [Spiribacter roseus]|uniref:hypothetical protein n=1 Tax=Spiribacter roseus TaxID=1855875 RepID=UPI00132FA830|nr:hypothetical protein [Spiribacter roseus]
MSRYPEWILERAFGGTHVAETPGDSSVTTFWPTGKSAPGAKECCNLLIDCCNDPSPPQNSVMVFLVGGAGNGKSFLAQYAAKSVRGERIGQSGKFANRNYDYNLKNGKFFRVLNDATIPPHDESTSSDVLAKDVSCTLEKKGFLLACVNRGILVSEMNRRDTSSSASFYELSCDLIAWLLDGKKPDERREGDISFGISVLDGSNEGSGSYYAKCNLKKNSRVIGNVHVVFMDQVSLLEPFPPVSTGKDDEGKDFVKASKINLLPLSRRRKSMLTSTQDEVLPLKDAFANYFDRIREDGYKNGWPGEGLDPVRANVENLSDEASLDAFCCILRASEILAGGRISYRDAWGIAVLATTGAMPSSGKLAKHAAEVAQMADRVRDHTRHPAGKRLVAAIWLASRRYPTALFSGGSPRSLMEARQQPDYPAVQTMESIAMADPVKGLPAEAYDKVNAKLMLLDEDAGPGAALADEDNRFSRVWSEVEIALEATLLEWLNQGDSAPSHGDRREVLSWYGQYLYRLYAVAHGLPAHSELVDVWQKTWNKISKGHAPADAVTLGLQNLIFTPYAQNRSDTVFPLFAPRVAPVSDRDEGSRIGVGIQSGHYNWNYRCRGDSILAELRNAGDTIGGVELVIDFSMLREIFAKSQGQGFTEAANDVEPRVERIRAEVLSRATMGGIETKPQIYFIDRGERLL